MFKHLLIPAALVITLVAGCFPPCGGNITTNCYIQGGESGGGSEGPCGDLGQEWFVWYRDGACGTKETSVCAFTEELAQAQADSAFGDLWHGRVSLDRTDTAPCELTFAAVGSCVVGSADGSASTSFDVFDDSEIPWCEAQYDPDQTCVWTETNRTCPGS